MDRNDHTHNDQAVREERRSFYEKLLGNLDREQAIQQSLLDLLEEERLILTTASPDAIDEFNSRKESLLLREQDNAAARREIVGRLCSRLNDQAEQRLSLSDLADRADDEDTARRLRSRQEALTGVVHTAQTLNRRNNELIQAALEDVRGSLRLLQSMVVPGGGYEETGRIRTGPMQGTLIQREG
ncbi:MAG: flagellar protein FlgN [Deltaproteobacteria bacterium]|nr:flagellar protein FlgN [Deltaproteobacteria bacterium]